MSAERPGAEPHDLLKLYEAYAEQAQQVTQLAEALAGFMATTRQTLAVLSARQDELQKDLDELRGRPPEHTRN